MKKNIRKISIIIFLTILVSALAGVLVFYFHALHYINDAARKADVAAFVQEDYEFLYMTMYSEGEASAYPFEYYLGLKTYKTEHRYENLKDFTDYVDAVLAGSSVREVYSLFDPAAVNESFFGSSALSQKAYQQTLKETIVNNGDINFVFMLPAHSLKYWCDLSERKVSESLGSYLLFANELKDLENVRIYFFGNQQWLIANSHNYADEKNCAEDIINRLVALSIYNDDYLVSGDKLSADLADLEQLIAKEKNSSQEKVDLSEYEIVFFGDSVVGNYFGSLSIPGVVAALSGAETYNCAIGGQAASKAESSEESSGLEQTLSYFLREQSDVLEDKEQFRAEVERYHNAAHDGKKLCLVLNYGLNDFFSGKAVAGSAVDDISTYRGALYSGIVRLRQAYPHAEIVLITPNFVQLFEFGGQAQSEKGGVLTDYVNAVISLAQELDIPYINNFVELGIDENNFTEYLEDGCHLNEQGRFEYARDLVEFLGK